MAKLSKTQIDVIKQGAMEGIPVAKLVQKAKKLGPATRKQVAKIAESDVAVRDQKRSKRKKRATNLLGTVFAKRP